MKTMTLTIREEIAHTVKTVSQVFSMDLPVEHQRPLLEGLPRAIENMQRILGEVDATSITVHPMPGATISVSVDRVAQLEDAIRKHRAQTTGHSMCWENDVELWGVLVDKDNTDHTPPPWCEFMQQCAAYRASREGTPTPMKVLADDGSCQYVFPHCSDADGRDCYCQLLAGHSGKHSTVGMCLWLNMTQDRCCDLAVGHTGEHHYA